MSNNITVRFNFLILKKNAMKLSKSLLTAIVIGIAVQTTTVSCSKDKPDPKKKEVKKEPASCPGCGMG
jgi:ribonuclease I